MLALLSMLKMEQTQQCYGEAALLSSGSRGWFCPLLCLFDLCAKNETWRRGRRGRVVAGEVSH